MIFGCAAVSWLSILFYNGIVSSSYSEIYMLVATSLWLIANFLWMDEEVTSQTDDFITPKTSKMMEAAMLWILFYYFVMKPLNFITFDKRGSAHLYEDSELQPRFSSYFKTWREYEHIHMFCWLGKDLSWTIGNPYLWIVFFSFTVGFSIDYIYTTYRTKRLMVRCSHYTAQLIWILGNGVWAAGELFPISSENSSHPFSLWTFSSAAVRSTRWWASWVFLMALVPIVMLYSLWLPASFRDRSAAAVYHVLESDDNDGAVDRSNNVDTSADDVNDVDLLLGRRIPQYTEKKRSSDAGALPYGTFE